jgi:hypothetical protein
MNRRQIFKLFGIAMPAWLTSSAVMAKSETVIVGKPLAKEVLEDFENHFYALAAMYRPLPNKGPNTPWHYPNERLFVQYGELAAKYAAELAPYQSPKFREVSFDSGPFFHRRKFASVLPCIRAAIINLSARKRHNVMGTITDRTGNVVGKFAETLEDWKQAAQVEAGIRRELQTENGRLRKLLTKAHQYLPAGTLRYDVERERPWRDDHKG